MEAHNSKLCGNRVENNNFGLALNGSSGNLVYNNYLNNTNNVVFDIGELFGLEGTGNESNIICTWNLSKTKGTNIVGGPYKGGNYWALPNRTGFSQTQKDANKDGLSDLPYHVTEEELNIDFLPLSDFQATQDNCVGGNEENNSDSQSSSSGSSSQSSSSGGSSQSSSSGSSSQSSSLKEVLAGALKNICLFHQTAPKERI